jgi:hypothetical protein
MEIYQKKSRETQEFEPEIEVDEIVSKEKLKCDFCGKKIFKNVFSITVPRQSTGANHNFYRKEVLVCKKCMEKFEKWTEV